jgi:hypothetical protein
MVMRKQSNHTRPTAPKVYRPQPVPKVLQTKGAMARPQAIVQSRKVASGPSIQQAVAPPVYPPLPAPRVLQKKSSSAQSPKAGQVPRQSIAPPVYRPEAKKIVHLKSISAQRKSPTPPPVYRPEQKRIAQPKTLSAAQPLRVQAKFAGNVLSASAIQGMGQRQVIQRAESVGVSSGEVAGGKGQVRGRDDSKDQSHQVKRVTRGSSKPPPNLNRLRLSFASSYDGVASQHLDRRQQIGFKQTATLFRPDGAPQRAAYYYDFRQQVKDSYTYHIPSQTKDLEAEFVQDNGFQPPYENDTTTLTNDAIQFVDHPGFSQGSWIAPGQWLSRYEVCFRWTVTRRDPDGNGLSWTSPEVRHTVECAYNEGQPVQITHHAFGNDVFDVLLV